MTDLRYRLGLWLLRPLIERHLDLARANLELYVHVKSVEKTMFWTGRVRSLEGILALIKVTKENT